ncbi:SIS domain-containing protein [Saccharobesus litoralis]|uniref:SIS domain-containing protein n=1 Tax=Saccharobesus litoralis TaxID=2172099 RepID=A0A2S0VQB6_9ALTE|nr:SIS domain-containing protein [Saccharobesus litoralis]AWB66280.1 SIS domain-containing protein [Saccharobesus litoralis]
MQDLIKQSFTESIQSKIVAADMLADAIENAAQTIVNCLLQDKKVICCGDGIAYGVAATFTSMLVQPAGATRPSLPAVLLQGNNTQLSVSAGYNQAEYIYAEQLKIVAQPGDVLLVLASDPNNAVLTRTMEAAVANDMIIIAITGDDGGEVAGLISTNDIEIKIPANKPVRIVEVQQLIAHCLCDAIVNTLFPGSQ